MPAKQCYFKQKYFLQTYNCFKIHLILFKFWRFPPKCNLTLTTYSANVLGLGFPYSSLSALFEICLKSNDGFTLVKER